MKLFSQHKTAPPILNYFLGIGIILIPFLNFFSEANLQELLEIQIIYICLSGIPFGLGAFILSWSASKVVTRSAERKSDTLFPLICIGFYLQFFYAPLKIEFQEFFSLFVISYEREIVQTLTLLLLAAIWLTIIILGLKYSRFFIRTLMVFTSVLLVLTIVPSLQYFVTKPIKGVITEKHPIAAIEPTTLDLYTTLSSSTINSSVESGSYPNIYFVIMDGMMSLTHASDLEIIEKEREITRLKQLRLTYIEDSLSSYSESHLALSSILQINYHVNPTKGSYIVDKGHHFQVIMNSEHQNAKDSAQSEVSFPIFYVLKKVKTQFIWQGNQRTRCYRSNSWACGFDFSKDFSSRSVTVSDLITNYINWTLPFYDESIIGTMKKNLRARILDETLFASRHVLIPFATILDEIASLDQSIFAFVHHLSPHLPFEATEFCGNVNASFTQEYSGYRENYRCALQEIAYFIEKINAVDPSAVVVIQGDHGWNKLAPIELSLNETISYYAKIFSAIKAPESCFRRYGIPSSTVNSIRFALNCAYGFKFPFEEDLHYVNPDRSPRKINVFHRHGRNSSLLN